MDHPVYMPSLRMYIYSRTSSARKFSTSQEDAATFRWETIQTSLPLPSRGCSRWTATFAFNGTHTHTSTCKHDIRVSRLLWSSNCSGFRLGEACDLRASLSGRCCSSDVARVASSGFKVGIESLLTYACLVAISRNSFFDRASCTLMSSKPHTHTYTQEGTRCVWKWNRVD